MRGIVAEADAKPAGAEREELLHDARKAAKRARYAGESVSRIFGKDAVAFAAAMEDVQEALGEHQDSVLTRERLRDLARHTSSTDAAFLYGRLHALEEASAARVAAALRHGVEGRGPQAPAPLAALTAGRKARTRHVSGRQGSRRRPGQVGTRTVPSGRFTWSQASSSSSSPHGMSIEAVVRARGSREVAAPSSSSTTRTTKTA